MRMRRSALPLALLLTLTACAGGPGPGDVTGPVTYTSGGVKLGDKPISWKSLTSLTETDPDVEALRAEYAKRAAAQMDVAGAHLGLAKWCRENGLADEAKKEFEAAIKLEPDNATARKGLSFVKEKDAWRDARDVFHEKLDALDPKKKGARLELAKWCDGVSLFEEEYGQLVQLLVDDAWDREAIKQMKPLVDRRVPKTALRPPFVGRWKGLVDKTYHHQLKCFAMYAIDWVKVDDKGSVFSGSGKAITDFYSWGQTVLAAADGTVTAADDHWPDMPPGIAGKFDQANFISIEHEAGEHTDYGHVQQGSALVKVGEKVKRGQPIARAGNSGAAGLPHIHFTASIAIFAPGRDHGQWLGIPCRFGECDVVEADGKPCSFHLNLGRPQEGWVIVAPSPETGK